MRRFLAPALLALGLLLIGVISVLATPGPDVPLDGGNAQPDGALALSLWLRHEGYTTSTSADPWSAKRIMVLTADLNWTRGQEERALSWARRGGHLVLAAETFEPQSLAGLGLRAVPDLSGDSVSVRQPLLLSPPVRRLWGTASEVLISASTGTVVAQTSAPVLVYIPLGRGDVWVLTAPDLLTNAAIAHADNRRLALNLAGPVGALVFLSVPAAGSTAQSYWVTASPWGAALLFTLLVAVLYRWLTGWRLGPAVRPLGRERPVVEYVVSLAGLLQRSGRRDEVLGIYQARLRRLIAARYGPAAGRADEVLRPAGRLTERTLMERVREIVRSERELRGERD